MTVQEFKELEKKAETELKMPDKMSEIIDKNNLLPTFISDWQKLYANQTYIVKKLEIDAAIKYGELVKYYKFQDNYSWGNAKEIDSQINANPEYCKMLREINEQKYFLTFITETLSNMKNLGFVIKNYLDYKKIINSNV
jgi:negative regulator of sigma E activity